MLTSTKFFHTYSHCHTNDIKTSFHKEPTKHKLRTNPNLKLHNFGSYMIFPYTQLHKLEQNIILQRAHWAEVAPKPKFSQGSHLWNISIHIIEQNGSNIIPQRTWCAEIEPQPLTTLWQWSHQQNASTQIIAQTTSKHYSNKMPRAFKICPEFIWYFFFL